MVARGRWAWCGFLVLRVPSESRRSEDRSGLALAHAIVVASATAGRRTNTFDHHSLKSVVSVASIVFSIARPDPEKVPHVLQSFVPHPLQDQAEIDKDVVSTDYDLPLCLVCEQSSQQVSQVAQTPFHEEEY